MSLSCLPPASHFPCTSWRTNNTHFWPSISRCDAHGAWLGLRVFTSVLWSLSHPQLGQDGTLGRKGNPQTPGICKQIFQEESSNVPLNLQGYETFENSRRKSNRRLCSILWSWKLSTLSTAGKTVSFSVCYNLLCWQTHTYLSWHLFLSFHSTKMSESVLGTYAYSYEVQGHGLTPKIIWKYCLSGNSNTGAPGWRGELWFGGGEGWREVGSKCVCACAHVKASWQP